MQTNGKSIGICPSQQLVIFLDNGARVIRGVIMDPIAVQTKEPFGLRLGLLLPHLHVTHPPEPLFAAEVSQVPKAEWTGQLCLPPSLFALPMSPETLKLHQQYYLLCIVSALMC